MKKFVVIVAGGSGSRMGTEIPKQFLELNGLPVLMHTIQSFQTFDPESSIILVLPENQKTLWDQLCQKHYFTPPHQIVSGGLTRFHSVKNGLNLIESDGIVFIHDGVRPFVSNETLQRCFEAAKLKGNAIPVLPVTDSLRKREENSNSAVDRSQYFSVQTPQTFRVDQIQKAFEQEFDSGFTDDASVAEKAGYAINMVEGNPENIKITTPFDWLVASAMLKIRNPE